MNVLMWPFPVRVYFRYSNSDLRRDLLLKGFCYMLNTSAGCKLQGENNKTIFLVKPKLLLKLDFVLVFHSLLRPSLANFLKVW